jgi:hypothetical protein
MYLCLLHVPGREDDESALGFVFRKHMLRRHEQRLARHTITLAQLQRWTLSHRVYGLDFRLDPFADCSGAV